MTELNQIGEQLSTFNGVTAMTDITGFGLAGHALELANPTSLDVNLEWSKIPKLPGIKKYIDSACMPGGTERNFQAIRSQLPLLTEEKKAVMCDPQTSGGLLIAVDNQALNDVKKKLKQWKLSSTPVGFLTKRSKSFSRLILI